MKNNGRNSWFLKLITSDSDEESMPVDYSALTTLTTQEAQQLVPLCREEDLYLASFFLPPEIVKKMSFAYSGALKKRLMANLGRPSQSGPVVDDAVKRVLENLTLIRHGEQKKAA